MLPICGNAVLGSQAGEAEGLRSAGLMVTAEAYAALDSEPPPSFRNLICETPAV